MNSNQQLHTATEATVPMATDTSEMESINFNNNGLKMPKYPQVSLALETAALIPQGIPPFQWVSDLTALSKKR